MIIIVPLVMAAMMLIAVLAVGAVTLSLSSAALAIQAVGRTGAARPIKLIILAGGCAALVYGWTGIGPVRSDGVEGLFEWAVKITLAMLAMAIVLGSAAMALKLSARLSQRGTVSGIANPYAAAFGGLLLGFGALVAIEYAYRSWTAETPPIQLSLSGEPTHCIWRTVRLYERRSDMQHYRDRYAFELTAGQRVQLDPDVVLTHERFTVRLRVVEGTTQTDVYGSSTDFRSLRHVDETCAF